METSVQVVGLGAEPRGLDPLGAEPLDHPDTRHRLLDDRGELGRLLPDADHRRVQLRGEALGEVVDEGQHPEGHQGQQPVGAEQDDGDRGDRDRLEIVSGISTMKFWTCCRSVLARLINWPVCASSWNEKEALEGEHPVEQDRLDQRASRNG